MAGPVSAYDPIPSSDRRLAMGVQVGIRSPEADALPEINVPQVTDRREVAASLNAAKTTLSEAYVDPKTFSPTALETFGAYFRSENTVGSAVTSESLAEGLFPTPASPSISSEDILKRLETDGLAPYSHFFDGVDTVAAYEATRNDLKREIEDKKIMQAATGITGTAAMLAAGIFDLPTLLPGSIGVRLGAKGVSASRAAAGVAAGAAVGTAVTETALQAIEIDRSWEESSASIGGSIILGGALGAGLHALARKALGDQTVDLIEAGQKKVAEDAANDFQGAKSAGAANIDAYTAARAAGLDDTKPAPAAGTFAMFDKIGNTISNARIPFLDLMYNSESIAARDSLSKLMFLPVTKGEISVEGPTVHALVRDRVAEMNDILVASRTEFNSVKAAFKDWADFDNQVAKALVDPDAPVHPSVKKIAAEHRRMYTQILDDLIDAKILPKEVKEKYGDRYVPIVFDKAVIQAKADEFKELIEEGFKKSLEEDAQKALVEANLRKQKNADARADIMGVVAKEPVVETKTVSELSFPVDEAIPPRLLTVAELRRLADAAETNPDLKNIMDERKALNRGPNQGWTYAEGRRKDQLDRALAFVSEGGDPALAFRTATETSPVVNLNTGKQKQRTVVLKEGELQRRQAITKEQYELEVDRVKENRELAESVHDYETRTAALQIDNLYDQYKFERQKTHTADIESAFSRVTGERVADVEARKGQALEYISNLDDEMTAAINGVEQFYTEAASAIEADTRKMLRLAKNDTLTSKEQLAATSKAYQEQRRLLAQNDRERRAEVNRLSEDWNKRKTTLLDEVAEYSKDIDDEVSGAVRRLQAQLKRDIDSIESERSRQLSSYKSARKRDREKLGKKYEEELAEAKKIRDTNLLDANEKAKQEYEAAKVKVREGIEGPLKYVKDGAINPERIAEDAKSLAQRWYDRTTQWGRYTAEHELDGVTDFLKKRRTPVAHVELINRGFAQGQATGLLEDYVRMAGTDAAIAKVMKKTVKEKGPDGKVTKDSDLIDIGDLKLNGVEAEVRAEYDSLRDSIFSSPEFKAKEAAIEKKYEKLVKPDLPEAEKLALRDKAMEELAAAKSEVETKLANKRDRDIENLRAVVDGIRGTYKHGLSTNTIKAIEAVSTLNYVRLMGGTIISSLTDPIKIAIATGFGNTVQGAMLSYHQGFTKAWDKASAAEKGITRATAWAMELAGESRIAQMADLGNAMRAEDKATTFMRNAANAFSKFSGITYWNAFWKQVSENATSAYLGQLAHKGFDNLNASEKKWLNSLRINRDGLDLIKQAHEAQPVSRWHKDFPVLDHTNWQDKEAARLVRHALGEEINNQVVTPQVNDRMLFSRSPGGKLVTQFRQHMVSNQMRFLGRQLQLTEDARGVGALSAGFVGLVVAGATVDYLKNFFGNSGLDRNKNAHEKWMDEWRETPGKALYNALDRSDALPGVLMEASSTLDKLGLPGPKKAVSWAAGDDPKKAGEASRFKNRSTADTVLGPTAGLANDALGATKLLSKIISGERVSRGDYRAAERIIPGQNIPYIQAIGNQFERSVGDIYSWPNPK